MIKFKVLSQKALAVLMTFLSAVLFVNANTASSTVIYQPRTPEGLKRFSRIK